ncbi:hypothetical protein AABB24_012548 [Solanum stoloniferum]|uniref:Uncharacterized protein n=1 Tax=Solanum stoloniferum TaxID=62892 RepID=A0ABD2U3E2_9SOLN
MEMGFCEVWWCEWCCCGFFGCVKAVSVGRAVGFVMTASFSGVVSSPEKMMRAKRDTGQWGCLGCCLGMSPEKGEKKPKGFWWWTQVVVWKLFRWCLAGKRRK